MYCNAATWNFITLGKSHPRTGIGGRSKQQRVVLRRRNTVVGGKCALPSPLLVVHLDISRLTDSSAGWRIYNAIYNTCLLSEIVKELFIFRAISEPTRPTQPFVLSRSINKLQLDVCHSNQWWRHLVNAYEAEAGMVLFAGKTV